MSTRERCDACHHADNCGQPGACTTALLTMLQHMDERSTDRAERDRGTR